MGKEAEDLSRHDKWLCMMYPRLKLLREFLCDDGAIFVSIDDYEMHRLKQLLDEIFGQYAFVASFIWKRRTTPDSRNLNGVSGDHEYVFCYAKGSGFRVAGAAKDLSKYSNPDQDPLGPWMSDNLTGLANAKERPNLHYDLVNPATLLKYPPHPSRGWIYGPERMNELVAGNRILWPAKHSGRPRLKRYLSDMQSATMGLSTILDAPGNVEATKELSAIMGPKTFAFPKPSDLVSLLIDQATKPGDLVMDSFAGSGTTGHAVLKLNHTQPEQPPRRFILAEIDSAIARSTTAERIRRVSQGYTTAKSENVEGIGGGFRYVQLGDPLFDAAGKIKSTVRFRALARHVFFTETGTPLPHDSPCDKPLLGVAHGTGVYLLYNGILKDKSVDGGNVLTQPILDSLPKHNGPKVIYAASNRVSPSRLKARGITFKQTPYAIKVR